jgi:hypothetical protein
MLGDKGRNLAFDNSSHERALYFDFIPGFRFKAIPT